MAQYAQSIDGFKAQLAGGGVRPTMFQVEITFPTDIIAETVDKDQKGIFLIKAAGLPASTVANIDVPFRGRKLKVSGDRSFENWTVTVTNDISFGLRKAFETWSEYIQNMNFVLGANALDEYFATAVVRQLDRAGNQIRAYSFQGIWPTSVAAIPLNMDENDSIEDYDVEFCVQYWSAIDDGDPDSEANATDASADEGVINS